METDMGLQGGVPNTALTVISQPRFFPSIHTILANSSMSPKSQESYHLPKITIFRGQIPKIEF